MRINEKILKGLQITAVFFVLIIISFFAYFRLSQYKIEKEITEKQKDNPIQEVVIPKIDKEKVAALSNSEIINELKLRKNILLAEIPKNPAILKENKLSNEVIQKLPEEAKGLVEKDFSVTGELFVAQGEDKNGRSIKEVFWLKENGNNYNLNFIEKPKSLKSAKSVSVKGIALDTEVVVDNPNTPNFEIREGYRPLVSGDQSTIVIVHNFNNDTLIPSITKASVENEMTNNADSVANFYPENSYGNVTVTTTVTNILTSSFNTDGTCHDADLLSIISTAKTAAAAYNPDSFDRQIYLFPSIASCGWVGLGEVGGSTPTIIWINEYNSSDVYSHELGHNLGAWSHANFLDCGALAIDTIANCVETEYGDLHDTMGWGKGHFNSSIKEYFEWLTEGSGVQTVSTSGTYTVNALENNSGTRAIKVAKPDQSGKYYYFEFRKSVGYLGYNSSLPAGVTDGVTANIGDLTNDDTLLIDFRPDGSKTYGLNDVNNVSLTDGAEFFDQINQIRVAQVSHTATSATMTITFEYVPPAPLVIPVYIPVYRFWNANGTHFYTASELEKNNVIARWPNIYTYEGVAYSINIANPSNSTPLYRLWNANGTHFYTASYAEAQNAVARWPNTFSLEGVAYNVSIDPNNASPVYRFWNSNGTHFYTASESEKNNVMSRWGYIYTYEGVGYYLGN